MTRAIHSLFPTPVMISDMPRDFTQEELAPLEAYKGTSRPNQGNWITGSNDILDQPVYADLKKFAQEQIDVYAKEVLAASPETEFYITTSWFNFTEKNQWHHTHSHDNSVLSGVIYFQTDDEDKITFHKPHAMTPTWYFDHAENTRYNSSAWWFPVKAGQLFLFPSRLEHGVDTKQTDGVRISLAFNTFVRGVIGSDKNKTKLIIK